MERGRTCGAARLIHSGSTRWRIVTHQVVTQDMEQHLLLISSEMQMLQFFLDLNLFVPALHNMNILTFCPVIFNWVFHCRPAHSALIGLVPCCPVSLLLSGQQSEHSSRSTLGQKSVRDHRWLLAFPPAEKAASVVRVQYGKQGGGKREQGAGSRKEGGGSREEERGRRE